MMRFAAPLLLSGLAACAAGPDYRPASSADLGVPARYVGAAAGEWPQLAKWWDGFGDPVLTGLIETARGNNLDIVQAAARLRQAREGVAQARAAQLPTVSGTGNAGGNFNSVAGDSAAFSNSLDARWTADLFGGQRRGVESSRASYEAAGYGLEDVRTAVSAEVARNYISARTLANRIAIAENTLATQQDNVEIAGFRAQAGLVSGLDVEQARVQRAATAASIPALRQSAAAARYRIAVLTGQAPGAVDALFAAPQAVPEPPASVMTGAPIDTLRQRPDVRAAERNLAAATAQIGVAQAQLYPSLTLSGNVGTSSTALRTLGDVITGQLFASLAQTIFDGGRLRAVVWQRRAQADEALAAYKGRVLGALEDVENGLAARESAAARAALLAEQVDAANAAAILARSNYRAGISDFRTLLEAERSLLSARDGLANAQGDRASSVVQLYLALGGGWDPERNPTQDNLDGRR